MGWKQVRDGLEVKLCRGPEGEETFILCRLSERVEKEKAMHERFADRIRAGLQSLERRLNKARKPADRSQVERQIGRLLERNRRAAQRFRIVVHDAPSLGSGLRLEWCVQEEWAQWARRSEGCYVLRTNVSDWTAEELWQAYVQLTQAEAAFRIQKTDLSIRPIWHQRSDLRRSRELSHLCSARRRQRHFSSASRLLSENTRIPHFRSPSSPPQAGC